MLCMYYPSGQISALITHNKGVLNGITMAFYEDHKPKTYAGYTDGAIDGIVKLWNEKGERMYWCQYDKGVRNGFCCYFKDNVMQMILEIDHDAIKGVHLCANGELKKSFSSLEQASADKVAQKLLDEVDGLETELKLNERLFKRQVKEELQHLRQRKSEHNSAKAGRYSRTASTIALSKSMLIKSLRNFCSIVRNCNEHGIANSAGLIISRRKFPWRTKHRWRRVSCHNRTGAGRSDRVPMPGRLPPGVDALDGRID